MPKKPIMIEPGTIFGKLMVINCDLPPRKRALVRCECGKEFAIAIYSLLSGRSVTCGNSPCSTRCVNLNGKIFGFLTVIEMCNDQHTSDNIYWICRCECGIEKSIRSSDLLLGLTKSCGCKKNFLHSKSAVKPLKQTATNTLYSHYRTAARNRKINFSLSNDDFAILIQSNCYYCGVGPIGKYKRATIQGDEFFPYNGIDRIDSNIGYTIENCVACCKICNIAKSDYSLEEFKEWINRLTKYQFFINGQC